MTAIVIALLLAVTTDSTTKQPAPSPGASAPAEAKKVDVFWDLQWMLGSPGGPLRVRRPGETKKLRSLGVSLYAKRCARCHGDNGDGKGATAASLRVPPANFADGVYKLRSTPSASLPTDEDLFTTLTRGMHGTPMLPWKQLSETERWALVFRLKSFSPRFQTEHPAPPIRIPNSPTEDDALRERGKTLYTFLKCAACHGEEGAGDGPPAAAYRRLDPNHDVPIRNFTRGRFIRGTQMEDIFLTLRTGLDGTPMISYETLLREDETWAVAAYVRSLIRERPVQEFPPARTIGQADAGPSQARVPNPRHDPR